MQEGYQESQVSMISTTLVFIPLSVSSDESSCLIFVSRLEIVQDNFIELDQEEVVFQLALIRTSIKESQRC